MSEGVQKIYSDISNHYDTVNAILSFGTMGMWRRIAASRAVKGCGKCSILDVATGTGELAFEMLKAARVNANDLDITASDFNSKMLHVARRKNRALGTDIKFELGDALRLKYKDRSFDLVTCGFGLKNLDDLGRFSSEVHRVLRKGGHFVFLDMARPDGKVARKLIGAYWALIGAVCRLIGKESYISILSSINEFDKPGFVKILRKSGFRDVRVEKLPFGPAFLVTGKK